MTIFRMTGFDIPSILNRDDPFETRYRILLNNVAMNHPFLVSY